jgi:hypothetical protein
MLFKENGGFTGFFGCRGALNFSLSGIASPLEKLVTVFLKKPEWGEI